MAKQSKTSITENAVLLHLKNKPFRAELSCSKIVGFHLQKMKNTSTWRFRYRDLSGKAKIINLGKYVDGKKDRLEAAELAISYRAEIDKGIDPTAEIEKQKQHNKAKFIKDKSSTLGAYLDGVYTQHQSRKKDGGKHTLSIIRSNFKEWLELPMSALSNDLLETWQAGKEQKGTSFQTILRAFGALRTMIRHAISKEFLDADPIKNFKLAAPTHEEKAKMFDGSEKKNRRMFTNDELAKIREGAEMFRLDCNRKVIEGKTVVPSWFYYFFRLAAYTGMRTGDLYSLNWTELNLNFARINKTPQKTLHHRDPIKIDLQLDDETLSLMKQWHILQGKPTDGLVFANPETGKQYDRQRHKKHWLKVLNNGGINYRLDFYSLRHHCISKMITSGVPMFTVARLAGHKSTRMIESNYGHLAPNASVNPLALVASDFSGTKKEGAA
jgi:integrase